MTSRTPIALALASLLLTAGCGSDQAVQTPQPPKPDVAGRVVQGDTFLGFQLLSGLAGEVRTDPATFSGDSPGLYPDPQKAATALRQDAFVAGIAKIFKAPRGVGAAGSIVVQMKDAQGAAAEFRRQVAAAQALPCPEAKCARKAERFAVKGLPDATGVDLKSTFAHEVTRDGMTFRATDDLAIVFTKGAFVYQLFAGGPGMNRKRDSLVSAAQAQYYRVPRGSA